MYGSSKVYVNVTADFDPDGLMLPKEIVWEDGCRYEIDKVREVRMAAAMTGGGYGDRYSIVVNGKPTYIFFERSFNRTGNNIGRWFVERKRA